MRDSLNTISWLARFRWALLFAQSALILIVQYGTPVSVPVKELHLVLGVAALTNLGLWWASKSKDLPTVLVPLILTVDCVLLTIGLNMSGGPMNPFTIFYVVLVALAAFLTPGLMTWAVLVVAIAGYAALYYLDAADPHAHHQHHAISMDLHIDGMWFAMAIAGAFIVYFLTTLRRRLDEREAELATLREQHANQEKLVSMTSLAAGAAHEMATPLASISIASKELELELERRGDELLAEAKVIREQTQRCEAVLKRLANQSGHVPGESRQKVAINDILERAVADFDAGIVEIDVEPQTVCVPVDTTVEAIRELVKNSIDAQATTVRVTSETTPDCYTLKVTDNGTGLSPSIAKRAIDPFFSTKGDSPEHMGLGLFIVLQLMQSLGGDLKIESDNHGTTISLGFLRP